MAGISRRCKRRPNSGIGGCTGNGAGTPPVVYPGTPTYPVPRPPSPYAPPPRGPAAPRVRTSGTVIDVPFNVPIVPLTSPAPIKVWATRVLLSEPPQFIDGVMVAGVGGGTPVALDATLTTGDSAYCDENVVLTLDSGVSPISSADLVDIEITDSSIQCAVDGSYVPAITIDNTVVLNESTVSPSSGGGGGGGIPQP